MIRRPTWILLAILAVLAALAWYLESTPAGAAGRQTPAPTAEARLLPDMDSLGITRIEAEKSTGGQAAVVRNANGQYVFEGQAGKDVDQGAVLQLASELAALKVISSVQSNVSEETIGLTTPAATLTVENAQGVKHVIRVGNPTPVENGYYVVVDAQPPVVVSKEGTDRILELAVVEALTAPTPTPLGTPAGTEAP